MHILYYEIDYSLLWNIARYRYSGEKNYWQSYLKDRVEDVLKAGRIYIVPTSEVKWTRNKCCQEVMMHCVQPTGTKIQLLSLWTHSVYIEN